ncbi:hypothetical protein GCM10011494_02810 [Novosphingobium endophyticum]|uniref:Phosphoribosyltransferase n=1 Tax=Novosphingobium endophyticum TaxID=1955250 RepID=A0A916X3Z8_9SPHN|nr:hypothetical protein [Novosphingobium endophyticum]GGB87904.1 hypothetical protein GCM10011494_02810 [Novosphingobium endophyticum]
MNLHGIVYYRGKKTDAWDDQWRGEDYSARNLVKGLKGLTFNGSSTVTVGSTSYSISDTVEGRANALTVASIVIAGKIYGAGYKEVAIVPVPSSSHTDPSGMFVGRRIADAIQSLTDGKYTSSPVLYFHEAMPKSAGGGTRNPYLIQANLRFDGGQSLPASAVLIDDVCTTGAHLKAAQRFLSALGLQVADSFVVGRTARERPNSMFKVDIEEIDTSPGLFG